MRAAIVLCVMALPLISYSFGDIGPAAARTPVPSQSASASPASAMEQITLKDTPASPDVCRAETWPYETWPYLSKECLRGAGRALQPRQIAIAAAASPGTDDGVKLATSPL